MADANDDTKAPEGAPPPATLPELEMQRQVMGQLAGMISPFCPNMEEPALLQLAAESLAEQHQIHDQVMPTFMLGTESLEKYPTITVRITAPDGTTGSVAGPKRLEGVDDPQPAISQALVVALLLTPSARATLKAWGFQVTFAQAAQDTRKPADKAPVIHRV